MSYGVNNSTMRMRHRPKPNSREGNSTLGLIVILMGQSMVHS